MNDYISRQTTIDDLREILNDPNCPLFISATIHQILESIPAADVRPVVYAEPVRIFNDPYTGRMFTTCSRCTGKISPKDKFCKHCGADMRGKQVQKNI